jgi:alkyldihydroxyacetonephosphate synthase
LGILTRAVVRVRRRPASERFAGIFFRSWEDGVAAVRRAAQSGLPVSMLRLSDPIETEVNLRLSGHPALAAWAKRSLRLVGYGDGRCLLLVGLTDQRLGLTALGGLPAGNIVGRLWQRSRFRAPYLRNSLWEAGYALDTFETAVPWSEVVPCARDMTSGLSGSGRDEERALAFAHLSHVYPDGASVYGTVIFRRSADPDETLARWRSLKDAATRAVLSHGGTISHQHGVGLDHAAYLAKEKGALGMTALTAVCRVFDPQGRMNPGKLLD